MEISTSRGSRVRMRWVDGRVGRSRGTKRLLQRSSWSEHEAKGAETRVQLGGEKQVCATRGGQAGKEGVAQGTGLYAICQRLQSWRIYPKHQEERRASAPVWTATTSTLSNVLRAEEQASTKVTSLRRVVGARPI
jgi:hypothetical protein